MISNDSQIYSLGQINLVSESDLYHELMIDPTEDKCSLLTTVNMFDLEGSAILLY